MKYLYRLLIASLAFTSCPAVLWSQASRSVISYTTEDGFEYQGETLNGWPDGKGTGKWPDGSSYSGLWTEGYMDGNGCLTTKEGHKVEAVWEKGYIVKGTIAYSNADYSKFSQYHYRMLYKGELYYDPDYKEILPQGEGTMYYSTGSSHTGEWIAGKRNGKGEFKFADGRIILGKWKDDCFYKYEQTPEVPKLFAAKNQNLFTFKYVTSKESVAYVVVTQYGFAFVVFKPEQADKARRFIIRSASVSSKLITLFSKPLTDDGEFPEDAERIRIYKYDRPYDRMETIDYDFSNKNYSAKLFEENQILFVDLTNFLKGNATTIIERGDKWDRSYSINLPVLP